MNLRFEIVEMRFQVVDERIGRLEQTILATLNDKLRKQTLALATLIVGAAGIVITAGRV